MAILRIAVTQIRYPGRGQTYFRRRMQEGNSRSFALRCLNRRVARAGYHALRTDAQRRPAGDGVAGSAVPRVCPVAVKVK